MSHFRHWFSPLLMRLMVTGLKYMHRWLPFIARPMVQWVADNEVIACGLMPASGNTVNVIFSPAAQQEQSVVHQTAGEWNSIAMEQPTPFVGELVTAYNIPEATQGDTLRILAQKNTTGKNVKSPDIHVKAVTDYIDEYLQVKRTADEVTLSWPDVVVDYEAMIFFVGVTKLSTTETADLGVAGLYTRETSMHLPSAHQAALHIGEAIQLEPKFEYRIQLLVVDYEGWVPLIATQTLRISAT